MNYPNDMDQECVKLCEAMNSLPGIQTTESCCGHERDNFCIFFSASNLADLPRLLYWFDSCHCGYGGWRVEAFTDCAMSPVSFVVIGPVGPMSYSESESIAKLMVEYNNAS